MRIQQIRNATLKLRYGGVTFLTDPWLQPRGAGPACETVRPEMADVRSPMDDLPEPPERIVAGVDCCLVSHLHFDHFSPDCLPRSLPLIAQNAENAARLRAMGFADVRCFEGGEMRVGAVTICKTTAVHGDNAETVREMGETSGFVLSAPDEKTLYLAGDTIWCAEVEHAVDRFRPGVIVVNCCEATLPVGRLIMDLADLERVSRRAPEAAVIASHLDSVNHALLTGDEVRQFVRERSLQNVRVPQNGETLAF